VALFQRVNFLKYWQGSEACTIKLYGRNLPFFNRLVFVPGKPFQPSLMFVGEAYDRVERLKDASLRYDRALLANIRLGWTGLPGTNTLAYYKHL
jgi:hypothetical protein